MQVLKWQVPLLLAKFNMHLVTCGGLFCFRLYLFCQSVKKKGTTQHTTTTTAYVQTLA